MGRIRRDPSGVTVALVLGLLAGFRALQVVHDFSLTRRDIFDMGAGTLLGFYVTFLFVAFLAIWRRVAAAHGAGWLRFAAFDAGMALGAGVAWVALRT